MDKLAANIRRTATLLKACQCARLRFDCSEASAAVLFGLCRSTLLYRRLTRGATPLEERARWVVDRFLHGASVR
jgi:hypothetical protein